MTFGFLTNATRLLARLRYPKFTMRFTCHYTQNRQSNAKNANIAMPPLGHFWDDKLIEPDHILPAAKQPHNITL